MKLAEIRSCTKQFKLPTHATLRHSPPDAMQITYSSTTPLYWKRTIYWPWFKVSNILGSIKRLLEQQFSMIVRTMNYSQKAEVISIWRSAFSVQYFRSISTWYKTEHVAPIVNSEMKSSGAHELVIDDADRSGELVFPENRIIRLPFIHRCLHKRKLPISQRVRLLYTRRLFFSFSTAVDHFHLAERFRSLAHPRHLEACVSRSRPFCCQLYLSRVRSKPKNITSFSFLTTSDQKTRISWRTALLVAIFWRIVDRGWWYWRWAKRKCRKSNEITATILRLCSLSILTIL